MLFNWNLMWSWLCRIVERHKIVKIGILAFFSGVVVCTFWPSFALGFAGFVLMVMFVLKKIGIAERGLFYVGIALVIGIFRYYAAMPVFNHADVAFYNDMPEVVMVDGKIVAEPDVRADCAYYVLRVERLAVAGNLLSVSGNVLIKMPRYPVLVYGEKLRLKGKLQNPPVFEGFNYAAGLAKNDIWSVMYRPLIVKRSAGDLVDGWAMLLGLKGIIASRLKEILAEPAAGIAAGVLLGLRSSIPSSTIDDFNATGLTHILAISGYNITLIISIFGFFLGRSGRRARFLFSTAGIVFFVLITGMSASVIRAAVMGWLVLFALFSGRKSSGLQTLLVSAGAMVAVNPRILLYDMSFQLSFLATLGILLYVPVFEAKFLLLNKVPAFVRESLTVTLAAQVFTVPLLLWRFGRLSLIAPITNLFFLPLIPAIMLFSAAAIFSSFLSLPITNLLGVSTWVLSKMLVQGVGFAADLPLAYLKTENFPAWAVFVYYALVLSLAIVLRKPRLEQYAVPPFFPPCGLVANLQSEKRTIQLSRLSSVHGQVWTAGELVCQAKGSKR